MNFWNSILEVMNNGFSSEGLVLLDRYAEQFINGKLVYHRFSSSEQHGCAAGGTIHVIASLLAAASYRTSGVVAPICDFKVEQQCAEAQAECIERWARKTNCWIEL